MKWTVYEGFGRGMPLSWLYRSCVSFTLRPIELFESRPEEIEELLGLFRRTALSLFAPKKHLLLNPTFTKGSRLVGGADADLVVDDMIIDIKTVKSRTLNRSILNQIVGYYLLSRIGGVTGLPSRMRIKKIGIYWSRHLHLDVWNVHDLAIEAKYKQLQKRFTSLAEEEVEPDFMTVLLNMAPPH